MIWLDECSFVTSERGRLYITRRTGKKTYPDCIQLVFRLGRTSFIVWGAISWGWKSKLVFLERRYGKKGINSRDYAEQVLKVSVCSLLFLTSTNLKKAVVGLFLKDIEPNTIFMEDGALVHKGAAKAVRKRLSIKGFSNNWPLSSPDLNPIKKVWLWIKAQII